MHDMEPATNPRATDLLAAHLRHSHPATHSIGEEHNATTESADSLDTVLQILSNAWELPSGGGPQGADLSNSNVVEVKKGFQGPDDCDIDLNALMATLLCN